MRLPLLLALVMLACAADLAPPTDAAALDVGDVPTVVDACATPGRPCTCRTDRGLESGVTSCGAGGLLMCTCQVDAGVDAIVADALDAAVDVGGDLASDALPTDLPEVVAVDTTPGDAPDAIDVGTTDTGVHCGSTQTACMTGGVAECVDIDRDARHCGGCGRVCCTGQACFSGACASSCGSGVSLCTLPGAVCPICVVLSISDAHCGACNRPCATGQACVAGACVTPACAAVTEPPAPMGVCDGRGRIACEMWAQGIAGGRPSVTAQCLTSPSGCAKADRCDDARDASTCRCGTSPACGANQVCELVGSTARCQCARL